MNNRQIVEVAALVSAFSPDLNEGGHTLPPGALEKFWERSQRRLKLWLLALADYRRRSAGATDCEQRQVWQELLPVLEEIFVSEVLTRVWGAILTAMDEVRQTRATSPIARNVLIGHLDARKRALEILVTDPALTIDQLTGIDTVRRRVERWTDLLLGHLIPAYQVDDFAFDAVRAREFGSQQLLQSDLQSRDQAWVLVLVGLRMAFPHVPVSPPHELLQEEIIASILGSFPPSVFTPGGPFQSILAGRVSGTTPLTGTMPAQPVSPISIRRYREQRDS